MTICAWAFATMSSPRTELPHPELHRLRTQLQEMLESMSKFVPAMPKPPIIDSSFDLSGHAGEDVQRRDAIRGMRSLKDTVKRDLDVLEKVLFNNCRLEGLLMTLGL